MDFFKWYCKQNYQDSKASDNFTYFTDWAGFNIPVEIVIDLYPKIEDLNDHDKFMYLIAKMVLKEESRAYFIGSSEETSQVFEHEIAHGLYYLNDQYRQEMDILVREIPLDTKNGLCKVLTKMGYYDKVIVDEIQAYLSTGPMPEMEVSQEIEDKFVAVFRRFYPKVEKKAKRSKKRD